MNEKWWEWLVRKMKKIKQKDVEKVGLKDEENKAER